MAIVLLAASLVLVVAGALLFTNAVEWAGRRLGLGHGAVGSVLAAVATALPESAIPVVAIVGGGGRHQVAIGSIVGAPLLLATLAMALIGIATVGFRRRRESGRSLGRSGNAARDLAAFLAIFAVALAVGAAAAPLAVRAAVAVVLVAAYVGYVAWTVRTGGGAEEEEPRALFFDLSKGDPPSALELGGQMLVSIGAIVGGAHLFVEQILHIAERAGVGALALSLVLAPLATELPEKLNSVFWARSGRDALALGNVTGAMVFQSSMPVAVALVFTSWDLRTAALAGGAIALAGGALALWRIRRGALGLPSVAAWALAYGGFVAYALAAT